MHKRRKRKTGNFLLTLIIIVVLAVFTLIFSDRNTYVSDADASPTQSIEQPGVTESVVDGGGEMPLIYGGSDEVPEYSGSPYIAINGNIPYFTDDEITTDTFESYAPLDSLGRCGVTYANICPELMPTQERGVIGEVRPTGWHLVKYDWVDGKYLYNRCHLIGYQLSGENANVSNLITGTRYLNIEGMLPFENLVADYVHETGNHVLYRVTPVFEGDNLLASGVVIEAESVEDNGAGIMFNVYCYNVQPGVKIDYATGESEADGTR